MKFLNIIPTIQVKNIMETQKYYEEKFGFTPHWVWEDNFGSVYGGKGFEIHLRKSKGKFTKQTYYINVDTADKFYEKMKLSGAKIIEKIKSTPWGMREFVVEENNGHFFRIGHGEKAIKEIKKFKVVKK